MTQGLNYILLGLNRVVLTVVLFTRYCLRSGKAVLLIKRIAGVNSDVNLLYISTYFSTNGFAPGLAELRPIELAHLAGIYPGAIQVT